MVLALVLNASAADAPTLDGSPGAVHRGAAANASPTGARGAAGSPSPAAFARARGASPTSAVAGAASTQATPGPAGARGPGVPPPMGGGGDAPRPTRASEPEEAAADGPADEAESLDEARLRELWDGFVAFVRQKKVTLGVCLISGRVYAWDGRRLTLRFPRQFALQRSQVADARNAAYLGEMFRRYFGHAAEIVAIAEGEERTVALGRAREQQAAAARAPVQGVSDASRPIVQRLIEKFDGEIIRYNA